MTLDDLSAAGHGERFQHVLQQLTGKTDGSMVSLRVPAATR